MMSNHVQNELLEGINIDFVSIRIPQAKRFSFSAKGFYPKTLTIQDKNLQTALKILKTILRNFIENTQEYYKFFEPSFSFSFTEQNFIVSIEVIEKELFNEIMERKIEL